MKDQIKRVLEMNKSGTITDDQATALIDELMKKSRAEQPTENEETAERPRNSRHRNNHFHDRRGPHSNEGHDLGSFIHDKIHEKMNHAFRQRGFSHVQGDEGDNSVTMSRFRTPSGPHSEFRNNSITMSSFNDVKIPSSEMNGNDFSACRVSDILLEESSFNKTHIAGSSISDLKLSKSEIADNHINGCKISDIAMTDSRILQNEMNGCSLRDMRLTGRSEIKNSQLTGFSWQDTVLDASLFEGLNFSATSLSDISFKNSTLKNCVFQQIRMADVKMLGCKLTEVIFNGDDSWSLRKKGLIDVSFQNCHLEKIIFNDCSLKDVKIINVTLSDLKIQRAHLSDETIDGNESFLKVFGLSK